MNLTKVIWLILITIPISSHGATSDAQHLDEIFNELEVQRPALMPTDRYVSIYYQLLQRELGDLDGYRGQDCRAEIRLSESGHVENVKLSDQKELCRKVFNTVWDVGSFPMPDDLAEASKLQTLHFTVAP